MRKDPRKRGLPASVMLGLVGLSMAGLLHAGSLPAHALPDPSFTVDSAEDSGDTDPGDGFCDVGDGSCTLRAAIQEANAVAGPATIEFDIEGAIPVTIQVGVFESPLPTISGPLAIDGTSQPGFAASAPAIVLNGSLLASGDGLATFATNNVSMRGLQVEGFPGNGISILGIGAGSDHLIDLNRIVGNGGHGIYSYDETRLDIQRNRVTQNGGDGIRLDATTDSHVHQNVVGDDLEGTPGLGNADAGIRLVGSTKNHIEQNKVGDSGDYGIRLVDSSNNLVEANFIGGATAFPPRQPNHAGGIVVTGATSLDNAFLDNSIDDNDGLGIDLGDDGVTSNDEGDLDGSPNRLQNFPIIATAGHPGAGTLVGGQLDAEPGDHLVQLFWSPLCDASGHGEGSVVVGESIVTVTEGAIDFEVNALDVGSGSLTATATRIDPDLGAPVETSEFSQCFGLDPTAAFAVAANTPQGTLLGTGIAATFVDISTDPDGEIVQWSWDFGDGSTSSHQHPEHTYDDAGTYTVNLTVTDDHGGVASAETEVLVEESIHIDAETLCGLPDEGLDLVASTTIASSPRFEWDFGDGANATGASVNHAWAAFGSHPVTVTLVEDDSEWPGASELATHTFTVFVYVAGGDEVGAAPGEAITFGIPGFVDILLTASADGEGAGFAAGISVSPHPSCLTFGGSSPIDPADESTRRARGVRYLGVDEIGASNGFERIEVRLYYTQPETREAGLSEAELSLWYWNGAQWFDTHGARDETVGEGALFDPGPRADEIGNGVFVENSGRNNGDGYVWAIVDHTSDWAVAGQPSRSGGGGGSSEPPATDAADTPTASSDPADETDPTDAPPSDEDTLGDAEGDPDGPAGATDGSGEDVPPTRGPVTVLVVVDGQPIRQPLDGLHGTIRILVEDEDRDERYRVYLVGQDGTEYELGFADELGDLNTEDFPNGVYTLEVRSYPTPTPGMFSAQQSYEVIQSEEVLIHNPIAPPEQAAGAAATAVGVVGIGALFTQTFWARFLQALGEAGKESAITVGEDRLRSRALSRLAAGRTAPGLDSHVRRLGPWVAFAIGVLLLAIFFTWEGVEAALGNVFVQEFLTILPIIGGAALVYFSAQFSLEVLANRVSGASSRFRFLWPGAIALAVSAVAFRTAFGYPGYVFEEEMDETRWVRRMKGIRALGVFAIMTSLLIPFILAGWFWRWDVGQAGMVVGLVAICTSTLPFAPLPGADVWKWRKTVSLPVIAGAFVLFFGFQLALLPLGTYLLIGLWGIPLYLLVLTWLFVRRQTPPAPWYARFAARIERVEARIDAATPAWWKRYRSARARAASRIGRALAWPVRALADRIARVVARRRKPQPDAEA